MTPRLVGEADAAEYVGADIAAFRRSVAAGKLPPPLPHFGLYDLRAIDAMLDRLSGIEAGETPAAEESPVGETIIVRETDVVFLTASEVAERWGLSERTLANLRATSQGIPFTKLPSGSIRYKLSDVLAAEAQASLTGRLGFSWAALEKNLKKFPELAPGLRDELLRHVKQHMCR